MRAAAVLALLLACGCQALSPAPATQSRFYSLGDARDAAAAAQPERRVLAISPTLIVSPPHAASGFDSHHMMYVRHAGRLEYFAHNEWVDTPARMLGPLIVAALERSGAFRAVVRTPSPAAGELRLDTEILRLQQDFLAAPSHVRFTLRAYLVESATRRIIATRDFDAAVAAATEDPYGGVVAAGRAVQAVLEGLAAFCAEEARKRGATALPSGSGQRGSTLRAPPG